MRRFEALDVGDRQQVVRVRLRLARCSRSRRPARRSAAVGIVSTELFGRSRPEIQWIGASKCVPVCSPQEKLFQYQPGPRASYAETSSIRNGQHWPISGGSAICGKSGVSVCVRSTTRMRRVWQRGDELAEDRRLAAGARPRRGARRRLGKCSGGCSHGTMLVTRTPIVKPMPKASRLPALRRSAMLAGLGGDDEDPGSRRGRDRRLLRRPSGAGRRRRHLPRARAARAAVARERPRRAQPARRLHFAGALGPAIAARSPVRPRAADMQGLRPRGGDRGDRPGGRRVDLHRAAPQRRRPHRAADRRVRRCARRRRQLRDSGDADRTGRSRAARHVPRHRLRSAARHERGCAAEAGSIARAVREDAGSGRADRRHDDRAVGEVRRPRDPRGDDVPDARPGRRDPGYRRRPGARRGVRRLPANGRAAAGPRRAKSRSRAFARCSPTDIDADRVDAARSRRRRRTEGAHIVGDMLRARPSRPASAPVRSAPHGATCRRQRGSALARPRRRPRPSAEAETSAHQPVAPTMRSASRTRLRSLPAGPRSEVPSGAPSLLPNGSESCGKPARPEMHSIRVERVR